MVQTGVPLTEARYQAGLTWPAYLAQMNTNRARMTQLVHEVDIPPRDLHLFKRLVGQRGGKVRIAVLTEDWCGDSLLNLPVIVQLAAEVPGMDLRIFIRSANPDLARAYAAVGITNIPVVSFYDARWQEIGHWVERPAEAHRRVTAWREAHPEMEALRRSQAPEDRARLQALRDELRAEMERWYRGGLWQATLDELKALLLS